MARKRSLRLLRRAYAILLRLYPKPYRARFFEPMLQTFHDLLRERAEKNQAVVGFALRLFAETFAAVITENAIMLTLQKKPLLRIALVTGLILMIPFVANQYVEGFNWDLFDFIVMGSAIFGTGLAYHLVAGRLSAVAYKVAVGLALLTGFILFWMNAAVGIIGNQVFANLLYVWGVLAIGFTGALLARFEPRGMARAMFAMALVQALIAAIALAAGWGVGEPVWPWRFAILTGIFVALWLTSGFLFLRAARAQTTPV